MKLAGAKYGLLLGVVFVLAKAADSRVVWTLVWAAQAVFLETYALLMWQRTRLFWFAFGGAFAALVLAVYAAAAATGWTPWNVSGAAAVFFYGSAAGSAVVMGIARYAHRREIPRLKRDTENVTLRDMFRFRHIPYWR